MDAGHGLVTIDRICLAVHRGVSHDGRFVGGDARNQEPYGDTRHRDNDLDRFRPSDRRNTLRPMSLVYCIDVFYPFSRGIPVPPYILRRGKVTSKVSYLVLYNILRCTSTSAVHALIL